MCDSDVISIGTGLCTIYEKTQIQQSSWAKGMKSKAVSGIQIFLDQYIRLFCILRSIRKDVNITVMLPTVCPTGYLESLFSSLLLIRFCSAHKYSTCICPSVINCKCNEGFSGFPETGKSILSQKSWAFDYCRMVNNMWLVSWWYILNTQSPTTISDSLSPFSFLSISECMSHGSHMLH